MLNRVAFFGVGVALAVPFAAHAEAPILQTGAPAIYLADNLEEKDRLGWCIDTVGRGFAEILHAHSCKPSSGAPLDTQYSFDAATGQIRSAAFEGKCVTFSDPENPERPFGLLDCTAGEPSQTFVYDDASMEIRIGSDPSKCMVVAETFRAAGPFLSRDLMQADCTSVEDRFKQWIVMNE